MKEERQRRKKQYSPEMESEKRRRKSPAGHHRARQSSPSDISGGESPPRQHRGRSRSPVKRKNEYARRSKSPRKRHRSDSRSPPPMLVKIKQEKEERPHRAHDTQRRERSEKDDRRNRHRDQVDRGRNDYSRHRERDREEQNLRDQRAEREFHNERRRERRQREERSEETENQEGSNDDSQGQDKKEKEKPNFELSGALLEDTNTFRGVVIKYSEPPESRIPKKRWRLYPFKNDEALPVMYIHRQSAYLLGRQRRIADIPIDHPSCSKQHAVLQYRMVAFTRADGTPGRRVRPYIIDLGSGNGTYLNNQRIESNRYYELKEKDVLKFGFSSREYVVLHEFSDTSEVDKKDDEDDEDEGVESPGSEQAAD
ncbi:smad nuclear-interacting protein 1 [Hyperolius riggenbachi]|uniref:smad nuclear-interacting protein 1 n=1 Tax=Hyperolius riggenbachi TaxID=752182 RepID=UPI0035A27EF5